MNSDISFLDVNTNLNFSINDNAVAAEYEVDTSKLPALVFLQGILIIIVFANYCVSNFHNNKYTVSNRDGIIIVFANYCVCKFHNNNNKYTVSNRDGIPELFEGNLNMGSDISDWIRREVTADEIEVNLQLKFSIMEVKFYVMFKFSITQINI